ncbi:Predicted transcriptional regulator containing CBS domains [Edaphobacillus lindanitolerans]|uniref:Predicted transcriptional regulator containing CBS domains n=1 Tax=Edaphobacillus lindanitolerans TaxID=550447 RepID=A0A1U7PNL9_9BACI|nr:Predicted transcriptional regulator containing CBS domains [Edaphobacillus lindanitolerans]
MVKWSQNSVLGKGEDVATKHEMILRFIEGLPVGDKISVRRIAREMEVSEGTAYRAIKEAENRKLVNTIERVGTIRIEQKKKENIERLTFAEVVNIVDGQVLGGRNGLHKTLTKFVIGAMQMEDMLRYTDPGSLLIVGNRLKVHNNGLRAGAAVLITGGFEASEEVKRLADEVELPVISTSYDTFTVATMINRAIYDQLIEKEILLVEDIVVPVDVTATLDVQDHVSDFHASNRTTSHGAFPVTTKNGRLAGIVTAKDVIGMDGSVPIERVMTPRPISANMKMSVASAAHRMIWEGIDLMPVVSSGEILRGVISRQDVLKAIQVAQRQPHQGETIEDLVRSQMEDSRDGESSFTFTVTPRMTNSLGSLSHGALTIMLSESADHLLKKRKRGESVVENMTVYFMKHVQLGSEIRVEPELLDTSRHFVKMDFTVYSGESIVGKAMMMFQVFER